MLNLNASTAYKKDLKLCKKRGYDLALLNAAINILLISAPLPLKNKDHSFSGKFVRVITKKKRCMRCCICLSFCLCT